MGFITDLFGLIKRNTIVFKERINEGDDIVSFVFTPEKKLKWIPGQHAGFFIGGNQTAENTMRPFNIASTPDEGVVRIATRIGENPSDYKKYLMNLKPGDKMVMSGPTGSFYTRDINTPVLFVAGGVGIAPLRALLRYYSQKRAYAPKNIKLIYSSDSSEFAFKDELDAIKAANKFITIEYIPDRQKLGEEITAYAKEHKNNAIYFISGAPVMIGAVKALLKGSGINDICIKSESFKGYKNQGRV